MNLYDNPISKSEKVEKEENSEKDCKIISFEIQQNIITNENLNEIHNITENINEEIPILNEV